MEDPVYRLLDLPGGEWSRVGSCGGCEIIGGLARKPVPASLQNRLEQELSEVLSEFALAAYFAAKKRWLQEGPYAALAVDRESRVAAALTSGGWREGPGCPPFYQISTMLIGRAHRGGALLPALIRALVEMVLREEPRDFPTWVALRTCNAKAFRAMAMFDGLEGFLFYPRIDGREQDLLMQEMATRVAGVLSPTCAFDPRIGRIEGSAVPPDFYSQLPEGGPDEVRNYIQRQLTARDRLLCLALVATEKAKQTVLSTLGVMHRSSEGT